MMSLESQQLTLFSPGVMYQPPDPVAIREVTWSHSRRSTLEQCARRYYIDYFGANKTTAKREPSKEIFHFLKQLQNRHQRTGAILHFVIRTYFRKAQQGDLWDEQRLVDWARSIFRDDINYSQHNPDGEESVGQRYPPTLLREYHYRQDGADSLCMESEERLANALHTFATSPVYAAVRSAGCRPDAVIERHFTLQLQECQVSGQVDLAYEQDGRVTVVDWKTGSDSGSGTDSLQLAAYALWAVDHFRCSPEAVQVYKAPLSSGTLIPFSADRELLATAKARIAQDATRMAVLQGYGEQGVVEAFTPCMRSAVCRLCSYEKVCYDN